MRLSPLFSQVMVGVGTPYPTHVSSVVDPMSTVEFDVKTTTSAGAKKRKNLMMNPLSQTHTCTYTCMCTYTPVLSTTVS